MPFGKLQYIYIYVYSKEVGLALELIESQAINSGFQFKFLVDG